MSCTRPLKAFQIGSHPSGKPLYKICSYTADHVELIGSTWIVSDVSLRGSLAIKVVRDFVEIPCGKCPDCRLAHSRQWADRCMMEMTLHRSTYFLTLTYNEDSVPVSYCAGDDDGSAVPVLTLRKRDWQLFMKRLRKAYSLKHDNLLRFFACGEYGSKTFRPHYHAIIFGLELDDLEPYKRSELGSFYYTSAFLNELWPHGFVIVGEANYASCAYTARYVVKKAEHSFNMSFYEERNIEPEFVLMSRRPGIAGSYYRPELYEFDRIHVSTPTGGKEVNIPRYFDKLYERDFPDRMAELKLRRRDRAAARREIELLQTDLDFLEYCAVKERSTTERLKRLPRKEI